LFIFYCCTRGTLWHLGKFLQYIKYITVELTPPPFSFICPNSCKRFNMSSLMASARLFYPLFPYC
jgi:hypothetical protein